MGSPFASYYTKTIPLPSDESQTVTIQKLRGRDVERAQAAAAGEIIRGRGFAAKVDRLKRAAAAGANVDQALADPLDGYDRMVVVRAGIKAWTLLEQDGKTPRKLTPEAVEDLDDESLDFFATEIMKLTKPALFQTADEAETERKND